MIDFSYTFFYLAHWVLVAVHRLPAEVASLVAEHRPWDTGFSSCGAGLVAPPYVGIFLD